MPSLRAPCGAKKAIGRIRVGNTCMPQDSLWVLSTHQICSTQDPHCVWLKMKQDNIHNHNHNSAHSMWSTFRQECQWYTIIFTFVIHTVLLCWRDFCCCWYSTHLPLSAKSSIKVFQRHITCNIQPLMKLQYLIGNFISIGNSVYPNSICQLLIALQIGLTWPVLDNYPDVYSTDKFYISAGQ